MQKRIVGLYFGFLSKESQKQLLFLCLMLKGKTAPVTVGPLFSCMGLIFVFLSNGPQSVSVCPSLCLSLSLCLCLSPSLSPLVSVSLSLSPSPSSPSLPHSPSPSPSLPLPLPLPPPLSLSSPLRGSSLRKPLAPRVPCFTIFYEISFLSNILKHFFCSQV